MNILTTVFIAIAALGAFSDAAFLRVVEAGVSGGKWGHGPILVGNTKLCPSALFNKFTLECVQDSSGKPKATSAEFFVNGALFSKDSAQPYVLTGDVDQTASPWFNYPQTYTIKCRLSNGEVAKTTVDFDCGTAAPMMVPPPSLVPEMSMMSKSRASLANEPAVCVKIPAYNYNFMSGPWERVGSAMAYKSKETSRSTDRSGTSKLLYIFTAPATSRYAFTLDWETAGFTDYNDVWVDFPAGGWRLERKDSSKKVEGWIKAYQNKNGRKIAAYSIDFNPHAISTTKVLKKGQKYIVKLGGRSTQVKVFSIVMFPCEGDQCLIGGYWNNGVAKCSA